MEFSIREYKDSDREVLVDCMERLQDYVIAVDPLRLVSRAPEFGELYTAWLLGIMKEQDGIIYFAEKEGRVIGCGAGMLPPQSLSEQAGGVPSKNGRVQELYVDAEFRGEGVGQALMQKMEDYFRKMGCDVAVVEVFAPNKNAHTFYKTNGYDERDINLMK